MSFPLLAAHHVWPLWFNLGGRLTPVSIRDQMVRAQLLVDEAVAAGLFFQDGPRNLLVVGAGAAGVAAGVWASDRYGIRTLIVESGSLPFGRQAGCSTRWIDPCQYDWPVEHWKNGTYPASAAGVAPPLPWSEDWSDNLALQWTILVNRVKRRHAPLWVEYRTTPSAATPISHPHTGRRLGWDVQFIGRLTGPFPFASVVWTVGFGQERSDCGDFSSYPFWSSDPFRTPGMRVPGGPKRIIISGAGDGGLQDFLRIVCPAKNSAKEIFDAIILPPGERERIEHELQSAEDVAQRAYLWGPTRWPGAAEFNDHAALQTVHDRHKQCAEHLLPAGAASGHGVFDSLKRIVRDPLPDIHLIFGCDHFGNAYGLNRFLTLLLARYLELNGFNDVLIPRRKVDTVDGVSHTCVKGGWRTCHGRPHKVNMVENNDCRKPPGTSIIDSKNADVVVVRHGIDPSVLPKAVPDIALTRQMTSYSPLV